uniref:NAD(P)/FAD-dependent oxidoreductase n=1 Tax=Rheinheimera sp. TaxID=1869214 RepID=UPI0040485CB3
MSSLEMRADAKNWDIVIIGGALSGSVSATLLRRRNPDLKVLILERSEQLGRRVGESTVEISAFFLSRVLGLTEHLGECHLPKQGLRYWYTNDRAKALDQCSETGPRYNVRLPSYQVDRAVLDEHVLELASQEGAVLRRSARVRAVKLESGASQIIEWEDLKSGDRFTSQARWVIDASGHAALLARQENWIKPNRDHPIATCWSRWRGVQTLDDRSFATRYPSWANRVKGQRGAATNHVVGYGWWAWFIPLKGGEHSVGLVYDQRITELPPGDNLGDRLLAMLNTHPAAREMLAGARWQKGDVHFRRNIAYTSSQYATDGAVLVGDASGFIDPFYSPGLDWMTFTTSAAVALIDRSFRGKPTAPLVHQHNRNFRISYERTFLALYKDKYHYLGDYELMSLAFRLDLGLYYLGVVSQPFKYGSRILEVPPFSHRNAKWPFRLMEFYNRRLTSIAVDRRRRGTWGHLNDRQFSGFTSYEFDYRLPIRVSFCVLSWLKLELKEGWRSWLFKLPETQIPKPNPIQS